MLETELEDIVKELSIIFEQLNIKKTRIEMTMAELAMEMMQV